MIIVVAFGLFLLTAFTLGAVVGLQLQNEKPSTLSTAGDIEAALRAARELSDEDIAALAQTLVVAKVSDPGFLPGEYPGRPQSVAGCGIFGCGTTPIHARVIRKTDGEVMKVCCLHFRYYRWAYALVPHPLYPEENCRLRDDRLELPVGDLEAYRELSKAKQRAESLIIE